mmetsp:Transcript_19621/g.43319  ORF Transcript_19621/g.43319 Transcript_19621/m.43319 type:complete len:107 (-) Transcript_19621:4-324(-)
MVKETSGVLVNGDPSILTYIKHVCGKHQEVQVRKVEQLDAQHVFCAGQGLDKWLEEKIDAFAARNMLEPPEDTATFQGPAQAPAKGKGKRGQKRSAASASSRADVG